MAQLDAAITESELVAYQLRTTEPSHAVLQSELDEVVAESEVIVDQHRAVEFVVAATTRCAAGLEVMVLAGGSRGWREKAEMEMPVVVGDQRNCLLA